MEDTEIIFAVEESLEGGYTARALGCAIYTPWHRLLGGQRLIMGAYVMGPGATRGATAAGGRSC